MPAFDPLELNYSKIKAYLNCPFLYRYAYVEGKYAPHNPQSSLGVSVHRAIEEYSKRGGDLNDLFVYYETGWLNQGYPSPRESMEFYRKGSEILENYWLGEQGRDSEIILVERDFEFSFEKWKVKGTMDRVDRLKDGSHELIDYKMGFEDRNDHDISGSLQLGIYAIGLKRAFNIEVKKLTYWLLLKSEKISCLYNPGNEEKIFSVLRDTGEKILREDYSKKGNCSACQIKKRCPDKTAS
ncbi:MAG: PD-(D/E)XK nuclease family protein [Elusimicrobia bacterium]|nr:PD-(D/E)XK nuclease family protein [Elusimicrobiota bacterium]